MKIRLAFAAITLATLAVVGCQPGGSDRDPCQVASERSETFERWVREASMDGASGDELTSFCEALLSQYSREV